MSSQVTINSRGLVYSVILLLASVTLTVSPSTFISPLFLCTTESPDAVSTETWDYPLMVAWQEMKVSLSLFLCLSVCHASGPVCPPELLDAGPQAGFLSAPALRRLPPLLHWLWESLDTTPSPSPPDIIKSDVQTDTFLFHSGSSVSRTGRKAAALVIFDKGVFYIVLYWAPTQHRFGEF